MERRDSVFCHHNDDDCRRTQQLKRLLQLRFDCDSTSMKNVFIFVALKGVVANKKAEDGAYNDVIVYITLIRMAFTLTNQYRVAFSDCRRWYSPFIYFRCKMSSGYSLALVVWIHAFINNNILSWCPLSLTSRIEVESQSSNRSCNSRFTVDASTHSTIHTMQCRVLV